MTDNLQAAEDAARDARSTATLLGELYDDALVIARATARTHGYALAVHGSQVRDFDLMAMPWTAEASAPEVLAEAIRSALGAVFSIGTQTGEVMTTQPHGRLCWAIHLRAPQSLRDALASGPRPFTPYIDLSVMPIARRDAEVAALVEGLTGAEARLEWDGLKSIACVFCRGSFWLMDGYTDHTADCPWVEARLWLARDEVPE